MVGRIVRDVPATIGRTGVSHAMDSTDDRTCRRSRVAFISITREVVAALPELARFDVGLLHVFIQHTSASLSINENADADVPPIWRRRFPRSPRRISPIATPAKGPTTCRPT